MAVGSNADAVARWKRSGIREVITLLLPSKGRQYQLTSLISRISKAMNEDFLLHVILDPDDEYDDMTRFEHVIYSVAMSKGYWKCLNEFLPKDQEEPFIWLADDIRPSGNWLLHVQECWKRHYPDGLGLVTLNDGKVNHGGACFGMTTPRWLYVLFGEQRFPRRFGHQYLDTLVADRSKDLDRYYFCANALVEHLHPILGKANVDDTYRLSRGRSIGDKELKDEMDKEWVRGGLGEARKRLRELDD